MKLYFATSNTVKLREFRQFLLPYGIEVEQIDIDIPEMRYEGVAEVAKEKARWASQKTGKTIVAEDTGLYISALKGFPGACAKFVFYTIGLDGIMRLLAGKKDRRAEFRTAIGLAEPKEDVKVFVGKVKGKIAESVRCEGYGYDPVFIPDGRTKTYAEDYDAKGAISHRAKALSKFVGFLERNKL